MGNIATELSDYVIFTNDNPRTEDEKTIMKDIIEGVKKDNYEVNHNRKEAIEKGIEMLNDNDILLILGKGHEDYQIIGKEKIHFSDKRNS
jgi:UDP-N-acetylmuramoyl-L-alanyl-D-glutamate--2,6-diaminopimelate ligase